ncbi:MAG: HPr family phosphocarrier protein [Pseudomonadales bacterium]|nr:HPr family phosphocarrier protein [Pseudomonadales bacterium]
MHEATLTIVNRLGLHARAAGRFVNLAKTFGSKVSLAKGEETVDGKSIMAVMLLAAPMGSEVRLQVEGADDEVAFAALRDLINDGFGELD